MQKIRIDFDNPGLPQHISAVENDSQSRFFQATLYENGKAYTAPEGATYSIMYHGFGPQNQGWYDTINDGAGKRAACAVSGNVVTCEIARQALQVPGHVSIVLCVTTGKGYMLKSWPIECDCKNDRYDSTVEIQSFFYVTQISNESWTQAIQAVEELKNTIDPTLSLTGKAADAAKVGEAVNAEATRAKGVENQLKEDLANCALATKYFKYSTTVKSGGIADNGTFFESSLYYRTTYPMAFPENNLRIKIINPDLKVRVAFYSETSAQNLVSITDWHNEDFDVDNPISPDNINVFMYLAFAKKDGKNLTYNEVSGNYKVVVKSCANLMPVDIYVTNRNINNGYSYYHSSMKLTGLIDVLENTKYQVVGAFEVFFFDQYLSACGNVNAEAGIVSTPNNAKYCRISSKQATNYIYFGTEKDFQTKYYIDASRINIGNGNTAEIELYGVPSYYTDNYYFSSRLENIQSRLEATANGDAFIFITDVHVADNAMTSMYLMREILKNTSINKVICGGDIPTAYNEGTTYMPPAYSAERGLQLQARKYIRMLSSYVFPYADVYSVRGNHDFHIQNNPTSAMLRKPKSWSYNYLMRPCEKVSKISADQMYYYQDNEAQKIRYIYLNTNDLPEDAYGISQDQYDWLITTLSNVDADWQILLVGHVALYSGMKGYEPILAPAWEILKAYQAKTTYTYSGEVTINADFRNAKGKIIAYLCGHNHVSENYTNGGILTMSFICDAKYSTSSQSRGYKTTSESSIAVVIIDKDNSKIKEFNIGAGANRELAY